ncbi:3-isopropylmalate dehydratase, small subunit [Xenococcus sp. PCC 7305]|uniref:3-isopropylmalate dehydratase small subunit n=1 Tax=Xenococcus sp. PCC 7305 TaxID=102125 RepID=UPI0002AD1482|nr:3-isopropylmalate dehydratase small subunit [Xenococcus sp. PCC 7305]ELS03749.1 3-isopropylmalate dehydratase, small subunit [Xenococcus sp. PCC 7305]
MSQIRKISGQAVPVIGNDIDTDRIIPARFLRCVTFDGLGEQAFADDRAQAAEQHPFDLPQYQGANILVVNGNFGCGSSREHAPQSLARWGIKAIVGESFAEIFFGNCIAIGLPCVTVNPEIVEQIQKQLQAQPDTPMTVDLVNKAVTCGDLVVEATADEGARQMFIEGSWDNCGQLIQNQSAIQKTTEKLPYVAW